MSHLSNFVTLHPYFTVHPGKMPEFQAGMRAMVEQTRSEEKNLFYEFTVRGENEVFCREGYVDAAGLLAHLGNVQTLLKEAMTVADLSRLEVHGPAGELDQLRAALADFQPSWFVTGCGVVRGENVPPGDRPRNG